MINQLISTLHVLIATLVALTFATPRLMAAPPDLTNGGVPVDIRNNNLGPTGMRGWIYYMNGNGRSADTSQSRQILVTNVTNGSPAHGVIAKDDVILGVEGTGANPMPFSSDARMSFARAIADAEARDPATLKMLRWRAGTTTTVEITLRTMGAYSATAPYNCPKSSRILTEGAQWVFENETSGRYRFGVLSLLATGDPAYAAKARNEARALVPSDAARATMMSDIRDGGNQIVWSRGHSLIVLAEYYLASGDSPATRDATVLPGIEAYAVNIAKNSSLFGTVGHRFAEKNADGSNNGSMGGHYGAVNSSGLPCFLGLLLARECGLMNPEIQPAIDRASLFFASYTGLGTIPYGEHIPYISHESNGKSGLAAITFALLDDRVDSGKFFAKMATAAPSEREHGHTGAFFNYLWSPIGAAVGGEAAAAEHFKRIAWHLDLSRRWDGAFDYDCLNGEEDPKKSGEQYADFRMSTAALLVYALPLRKLHLTGRGHDPDRWLTADETAAAAAANDYDPKSRTLAELIADTGSWSPKNQQQAANELKARAPSTVQRQQLETAATNTSLPAHVRTGACIALGRIGNAASATVLASLLTDSNNHVRYTSAEALRYLPNAARLTVLPQILSATVETAKPWWPIDAEDPLQFAHNRLAALLFYGGSSWGPKGILWNNISGVDRELLYPAIRAVANAPLGVTRHNLRWIYPLLTEQDVYALSGTVLDATLEFAPADRMFATSIGESGINLFEKFSISEGVPAGLIYITGARSVDHPNALKTLRKYGASFNTISPHPDVIGQVTALLNASDSNKETKDAAQAVLDAIAADTNPRTITPLKSIQSAVADNPQVILPNKSTTLRVTAFDHAEGDSRFTWKKISGPSEVFFSPNGTAAAATSSVLFDGNPGTYLFEVTMSDSRGITEVSATVSVELVGDDTAPPFPNAATFDMLPVAISSTEISMSATIGSDSSGPVEYLFTETSGNPGGASSGWQTSPTYTNSGLRSGTIYRYTVTMRDSLGNTGNASAAACEATIGGEAFGTGGAIIEEDGYVIHTFTQDGVNEFRVNNGSLLLDILVVGGGGGGGSSTAFGSGGGGGGGAGGLVYQTGIKFTGEVNVFVGTGGLAGGIGNQPGGNGGDSSFGTLVALGGGGGSGGNMQGRAGGSGGGSRGNPNGGLALQASSSSGGFGNVGGGWTSKSPDAAGGGGGAGGAAPSSPPALVTTGGSGGIGLAYDISGNMVHYSGGGGGGAANTSPIGLGGSGGGGNGGNNGTAPTPGEPNTGGGGGGGNNDRTGADGGSGIVIIRYAAPTTLPPILTSSNIVDDVAGELVTINTPVTYTMAFSEEMDDETINASDFGNAGTSAVIFGAITKISPGTYSLQVTPITSGTLRLQVNSGALLTDLAGYALDTTSAILAEKTISVLPPVYGGVVTHLDQYTIHTFTDDGANSFRVNGVDSLDVDVLVVGGGGGGGSSIAFGSAGAGGGGAGGLLYQTGFPVSGEIDVFVGTGGLAGSGGNVSGGNGGNSSFGSLVALGGGGGAGGNVRGRAGGSGGGSRGNANGGAALQADTTSGGFGNIGGGWTSASAHAAGGGGGAGGAAPSSPPSDPFLGGSGGIGLAFNIGGTLTHYAGGGGGGGAKANAFGLGGLGGGGNGGNDGSPPTAGTPNTGAGGGGGNNNRNGAAGGSGTVIIRYQSLSVFSIDGGDIGLGSSYQSSLADDVNFAGTSMPLIFTKTGGPAWLGIAPDGTLSGTPGAADMGVNTFTVRIEDGHGGSSVATLNITVNRPDTKPVKIYILAGQSNMVGHGDINPVDTKGTLSYIVANDPSSNYQFLVDDNGNWILRDDVRIVNQSKLTGKLTAGFGANSGKIGPELGFGHVIGDQEPGQVLLVKAAWGGKTLAVDFRPPSSGGTTGPFYHSIVKVIDDAVANLGTYVPNYEGQGYEIAGFCWHQGYNDTLSATHSAEYEFNMANLIRDIRAHVDVPDLPVVIATTGMREVHTSIVVEDAQMAMSDATKYPEFAGNVKVVDTRNTTYLDKAYRQTSSNSPASEGHHWNRNAMTYLHIGMAMADEMAAMPGPQCPSRLIAVNRPEGMWLSWQNGHEMPISVRILRNGVEIAAAAPAFEANYLDATASSGALHYQLEFNMPTATCEPLTTFFNAGISELTGYRVTQGARLNWKSSLAASQIEVRRDGVLLATIPGASETFTDTTVPPTGRFTYVLKPASGSAPEARFDMLLGPPNARGALIYEPFDYPVGNLVNQSGFSETGLDGAWHSNSSTTHVMSGSLGFSTLETFGNSVASPNFGDHRFGGGRKISTTSLADNGLLEDGATLWFSAIVGYEPDGDKASSSRLFLALANNEFTTQNNAFWIKNSGAQLGEGVGLSFLGSNGRVLASHFRDSSKGDGSTGIVQGDWSGAGPAIPSKRHQLVVGKITWGAGATDTIEIFHPGEDMRLPTNASSTVVVDVDQSKFNTITFARTNRVVLDEIRFGGSYKSVTPSVLHEPVVYEPFDYPAGGLANKTSSSDIGMVGTWNSNAVTTQVVEGSLGFPTLQTLGNSVATPDFGDHRFGGGRMISSSALVENGLLQDGATLWFSALVGYVPGGPKGSQSRLFLSLANNEFTNQNNAFWIKNSGAQLGEGVGLSFFGHNGRVIASHFRDSSHGNGSIGIVQGDWSGAGPTLPSGSHRLIVGKITWGAGATDTIEIFHPGEDMQLPATASSTMVVNVDQSKFNTLTFARSYRVVLDEIRIGATYQSVTPAGPAAVQVDQTKLPSVVMEPSYEDWAEHSLSGNPLSGFGEDADRDGAANGIEAFFGTNPDKADDANLRIIGKKGNTFTFMHPEAARQPGDLMANYRWSTDMVNFQLDGFPDSTGRIIEFMRHPNIPEDGWTTVEAKVVSGTVLNNCFFEIRVELINPE